MSQSKNNALEFSSVGSEVLSGTGTATGNFGAIQIVTDSAISAIAGESITGITGYQTDLSAGTVLYGKFTSVTITSGLIAAHRF